MRTLYHHWMSASSRKIRVILAEKGLEATLRFEKSWERRPEFLELNPAGEVPVFVDGDGVTLSGDRVIVEWLEEVHPGPNLLGGTPAERAEIRRLDDWFTHKFEAEVTRYLVHEKLMKRFLHQGEPDSRYLRAAMRNIETHLQYIDWLIEQRHYLAGGALTLADIAAAAQISVCDYLGNVNWSAHETAKEWYMRVKSRKSFRPLLADRVPGLLPPVHYDRLDF